MVGMTEARQRAVITRFITNAQKAQTKEIAKGQKTLLDYVKRERAPRKLAPGQKTLEYRPLEKLPVKEPSLISKLIGAKPLGPGVGPRAGGLLQKLQTANAKDANVEKSRRRKQLSLGIKASVATITSLLMLKKINNNLEKSSGYLGAVFAILGKVFLMALMPIATVLGAVLMPTVLKLLDIFRGVLTELKGPIGDLIGGKIDVGQFISIAAPIMSEAFMEAGSVIATATETFGKLFSTIIWPILEPYFFKAGDALAKWIGENAPRFLMIVITAFVNTLKSTFGAFISGFLIGLSGGKEQFLTGMIIVLGGLVSGLAVAIAVGLGAFGVTLAGFPIALGAAFAVLVIGIATIGAKFSAQLGAMFGKWISDNKGIWNKFKSDLVGTLRKIINDIKNAVSTALTKTVGKTGAKIVGTAAKTAAGVSPVGIAARGVSGAAKAYDWLKGKLGFAKGGVVTKPTLGILGEAGPEAAIPLSKMGGMGGGATNITVNVDANVSSDIDLDRLADQISAKIYDNVRRSTTW